MGNRRQDTSEHFTKLIRRTMETPAWRALSPSAQSLYPWVKLEWRGNGANNNGKLRLSVRQAAERLGCTRDAAARAFHDLQKKGFLVVTHPAQLGVGGEAKSPAFEVTELALPGSHTPRKLFLQWSAEAEFGITKSIANNPKGRNGKTKSRHENQDSNVIKIMTGCGKPS